MNRARGGPRGRGGRGGQQAVFHQAPGTVHPQILKQARQSGQLNLSNRGLGEVPDSVWRVNIDMPEESKTVTLDNTDDRWWEQVDLTKLILASNSLRSLSDDIKLLPALTVLDVHDNSLVDLPDSLAELVNIQRLNISHNQMTKLPASVYRLKNMSVLLMNHNQVTELDESIRYLDSVEHLEINNNKLTKLPKGLGYLSKLTRLDISNNQLSELPAEIGDLSRLQHFDASSNQLVHVPETFGNLMYLSTLNLRHNRLPCLPNLHGQATQLKELYIGNNQVTAIQPDVLEHLTSLVVLDMRDNKLSTLPDEISTLCNLERLDLTNNSLSNLPYTLGGMNKLKFIVLEGNALKSIRRDIVQRGTVELKKYLRSRIEETSSTGNGEPTSRPGGQPTIGSTGKEVDPFMVASTKSVDYSNKRAETVPDDVWDLVPEKQVHTLDLSKNQISVWPGQLATVCAPHLKDLNLGFNKLRAVPGEVGLLTRLTYLDLRNNQLTSLPADTSRLVHLHTLILAHNRLASVPDVVYTLAGLDTLTVSDNQISTLDVDGALDRLTSLAVLDVRNNDVRQVPPRLGTMTQIRSLQLEGNAFKIPRPAVLAKGTVAVLEWLRDRIPT